MSYEVFAENELAIFTDVKTILAAKGKTRKRFRVLALYEKATGDLLAEVLSTTIRSSVHSVV